jgi:hypothetical protein
MRTARRWQSWLHVLRSANERTALAGDLGTDIGNVCCAGRARPIWTFSLGKRFPLDESKGLEFRADFFNLFNHANRDNPISDISVGDFARIVGFSSSPRIVQLSLKGTFYSLVPTTNHL